MPQATAYDAQGNPIPEEKLGESLNSGNVHFEQGARVHVRIGDKLGTVDASEVPAILSRKDAALLTPSAVEAQEAAAQKAEQGKKYKTVGQFVKTGIEGELQGQTFGLYGALAGLVAPDYAAEIKARQEAHPLWSAANELKGAAGATLAASVLAGPAGAEAAEASGGVRALGTIARTITAPARALGAVGRGAEGVTMAGLRGLGYTGATAPGRIGAGLIAGGATGAAEGGALGAMHEVTQAALENRELSAEKILAAAKHGAIIGGVAGGVLGGGGSAGREVLRAVSGGRSFSEVMSDVAEQRAVKAVTGNYQKAYNELTNDGANPDAINRVGRKLLDRGVPLSSEEAAIKALNEQLDQAGTRMRTVAQQVDKDSPYFDMSEMVNAAKDIAEKYRATDIADYKRIANKIERQVKPVEKGIEEGKLWRFEEAWDWRSKLGKTIKWSARAGDPVADAQRELYGKSDGALTNWVQQYATPEVKAAWMGAKEDYHDFLIMRNAAEKLSIARQKNRFNSPSDYGTGALGFLGALTGGIGAMGSALTGVASAQAHKVLRERGPAAIARVADTLAKVDGNLRTAMEGAITGKAVAPLPQVPPAAITVSEAAKPFLLTSSPDRFEARAAELQAVTQNPKLLMERVSKATTDLAPLHPDLVVALTQAVQRTNQFLLSKLPMPLSRRDVSLTPLQEPLRVPQFERDKFLRYADAVDHPESVVAKLTYGQIDREGIEALKATAPETWSQLRVMAVKMVAQQGKALPFNRRMLLSLAFDFNGDWSLLPQNLNAIQESFAPAPEQGTPPPPSAKTPTQASEQMQTDTQRLQAAGG